MLFTKSRFLCNLFYNNSERQIMARKRKNTKKLDNLKMVDGKSEAVEKIKELHEILGVPTVNPFGTNSIEEFEEKMDEMNLSDLQALAVRVGLFPGGSRLNLKNKLTKEFYSTPGAGAGVDVGFSQPIADPNSPQGKKLLKLMREGL